MRERPERDRGTIMSCNERSPRRLRLVLGVALGLATLFSAPDVATAEESPAAPLVADAGRKLREQDIAGALRLLEGNVMGELPEEAMGLVRMASSASGSVRGCASHLVNDRTMPATSLADCERRKLVSSRPTSNTIGD